MVPICKVAADAVESKLGHKNKTLHLLIRRSGGAFQPISLLPSPACLCIIPGWKQGGLRTFAMFHIAWRRKAAIGMTFGDDRPNFTSI